MNGNFEFQPTETWLIAADVLNLPSDDDFTADPKAVLPGALLDQPRPIHDWEEYFEKHASINMELPINDIVPVPDIPDYVRPSTSDRPIVLRTSDRFNCLDGWDKIEEARRSGASSIVCRVTFKAECTNEELAFEKAATRTKTQGGSASQAELVQMMVRVAAVYTANRQELFTNRNGGVRIKGQHTTEAEDNLVNALSKGLGKDPVTVKKYLNHGECLDFNILRELAAAQVPKSFFEGIQKAKGQIEQSLQGRELENAEIARQISEAVREIFAAYQENGNKLDQTTIKNVVAQFTENGAGEGQEGPEPPAPEQQPPVTPGGNSENEVTQVATDIRDQAASNEEHPAVSNDESLPEYSDPGRFEQRKDRVIQRMSVLASQAVDTTDNEDLSDLARDILAYGFHLCSELLPHELETILEDIRTASLG